MGKRAERRARAEQKIQDIKKELLAVFMSGIKDNLSYELTMQRLDRGVLMAKGRNPQEAHLVRTAYTRLTLSISDTVKKYKEKKGGAE